MMEHKTTFLLKGTEIFSQGGLDNAALENGDVIIDRVAGQYMQYGAYTSQTIAMPAFCNLNVSWNADIPKNTLIEVQTRVLTSEGWSGWLSFGKWAPDYPSKSNKQQNGNLFIEGDTLTVATAGGASAAQVQVSLFSNNPKVSPALRLVALSVRPLAWEPENGLMLNQTLYLPEYRIGNHQTIFGQSMELPLVLTALLNRFGVDALPEEIAYGMADGATGLCDNAAFGAAFTACCGHETYQTWLDLQAIRAEVRNNCAVAVQIAEGVGEANKTNRWVALHGFAHDEVMLVDRVLLVNPLGETDDEISCSMTITAFLHAFTGRAIVMRPHQREIVRQRPSRIACYLKKEKDNDQFCFYQRGEAAPLPPDFNGWIGCSLKDGIAHATTAKKPFRQLHRGTGTADIAFPADLLVEGNRYTVYAVDEAGITRTAQITIPALAAPIIPEEVATP